MSHYIAHGCELVFRLVHDTEKTPNDQRFFRSPGGGVSRIGWDPREPPPSGSVDSRQYRDAFTKFGAHVAAVREACAGFVQKLEIDWPQSSVRVTCCAPRHISPTTFRDILHARLGIIRRRDGLLPEDPAADDAAMAGIRMCLRDPDASP